MSQIKLLLDEDVWLGLAAALREQGFDVTHVNELERKGLSDAKQLAYAAQSSRAILTHNAKDFVPLAVSYFFEERPHAGVIITPQLAKGELSRRVLTLLRALAAEEITNTVRHLADFT
jgi:predicted nuclease of predicted toxin-antitoxin system